MIKASVRLWGRAAIGFDSFFFAVLCLVLIWLKKVSVINLYNMILKDRLHNWV